VFHLHADCQGAIRSSKDQFARGSERTCSDHWTSQIPDLSFPANMEDMFYTIPFFFLGFMLIHGSFCFFLLRPHLIYVIKIP
jgi:hypothetical protein